MRGFLVIGVIPLLCVLLWGCHHKAAQVVPPEEQDEQQRRAARSTAYEQETKLLSDLAAVLNDAAKRARSHNASNEQLDRIAEDYNRGNLFSRDYESAGNPIVVAARFEACALECGAEAPGVSF